MKKILIITGLVIALACAIAWLSWPQTVPPKVETKVPATAVTPPEAASAPQVPAPAPPPPAVNSPTPAKSVVTTKPPDASPAEPPLKINGYEVQDPMARVALSFVGADPDANAYWVGAINDPALPAGERKDLIEDLNEDGLSDPHHPNAEDIPLIVSRLRLIERLAPNSLDDVNADAFAEAYKDLARMLAGQPPR